MATITSSKAILITLIGLSIVTSNHRHIASLAATLNANVICNSIPSLTSKQRFFCQSRPDAMVAIGRGAKLAHTECQWQFRQRRWNCTLERTTSSLQLGSNQPTGSREAGYAVAIKSSSMAHSIAESCSRGLLNDCSCDKSKPGGSWSNNGWEWGGCSVDIKYGTKMAQIFLNAGNKNNSPRDLMNLHNSRAGCKLLEKSAKIECKCHGPSGSCSLKTCWMTLPTIREVGCLLMKRYHKAKRALPMQLKKRQKKKSKIDRGKRNNSRNELRNRELIYLDESPNYCEYNPSLGSFGTQGRQCNSTSSDEGSCQALCCDRGFITKEYMRFWQCDCKFHWCCHVTCKECQEKIDIHSCK